MAKVRGVFRRGNVLWVRYAGIDGRIIKKSAKTTSVKKAQDFLVECKKEVLDGKQPVKPMKNCTFRQLATEYSTRHTHQRYFKTKKYFIAQLVERFGNVPLNSFNVLLIEGYRAEAYREVKPATVNRRLTCLKHMLKKAVEYRMVGEDVLMRVREVELLKEPPGRLRYLSEDECQILIDACSPHLRPIVVTALNSGMRKGEILSLRWDRIDLRHGFILLDVTKNGKRREIPINSTLRATLEAIPHGLESEYVFVDRNGRTFKDVKKSFATACRKAGIIDFKFHDLRHCFASHLVMAGVDIRTVQELLGHKTLRMTIRYSHLAPSHKVRAVEKLAQKLTQFDILDEGSYCKSL
ncbi:MAG: tyrosine-type recombinase/integrase [Planctomycetota bacterium]|jgi:integrase